jgi:hypothetical protein
MHAPPLRILTSGKGSVILSEIDISTGMLNTNTSCVCGYAPESCEKLVENSLMWACGTTALPSATQPAPTTQP